MQQLSDHRRGTDIGSEILKTISPRGFESHPLRQLYIAVELIEVTFAIMAM